MGSGGRRGESIPDQGTKVPHALWLVQKKKDKTGLASWEDNLTMS